MVIKSVKFIYPIFEIIKSIVHFVFRFFFACLLFSSHRLCVLQCKALFKKDHRISFSSFFFCSTFLCLPLFTSYIHIHIYICLIITHILFFIYLFSTQTSFCRHAYSCCFVYFGFFFLLHFFFVCVFGFSFFFFFFFCVPLKKTGKKTIERYSHLFVFISTDVILCMISNID